ncbi:MAG TPA: hypothetical protein VKE69_11075, partial [Planctomycetota bacterium]|nr:hypothetical protein [Planctomycetota bacterium]
MQSVPVFCVCLCTLACLSPPLLAQDLDERIRKLESEFDQYRQRTDQENRSLRDEIARLKEQLASRPAEANRAVDDAIAELEARIGAMASKPAAPAATGPRTAYLDLSFDVLSAVGASQATDDELDVVQPGGHDPNQRGFTLQNAELSLQGAVDPYLRGDAHIVFQIDKA